MPSSDIDVRGGEEFDRAATAMRRVSDELARDLGKVIEVGVEALAANARSAVMAIPTTGQHGSGLRAKIASAVNTDVNVDLLGGVDGKYARGRIYVDGDMIPTEQSAMPALLNESKGWRHPVFGHETNWVHQRGRMWFRKGLTVVKRGIKAGIEQTMERHADKVHRSV